MTSRDKFLSLLKSNYPALDQNQIADLTSTQLISNYEIKLPTEVFEQAESFAKACGDLRRNPKYIESLTPMLSSLGIKDPGNDSIAMSYDFHLTDDNKLKLIEVNTNAAFLFLGEILFQATGSRRPISEFNLDSIRICIESEIQKYFGEKQTPRIAIIDENPEQQRLYVEFLVCQQIFRSWGWDAEIADSRSDLSKFNFAYNRDTDFLLQNPDHQNLRELWLNKKICLSPNPFQYHLYADKQRMLEWQKPDFAEKIQLSESENKDLLSPLLESTLLTTETADMIWQNRKKYFLKPARSFGAKQSYRGGSISRKLFDELINQDILAQEFAPAKEIKLNTPDGEQNFKFDLRFYAYADKIQTVLARLYQGQVTNLKTLHGGFAPVVIE